MPASPDNPSAILRAKSALRAAALARRNAMPVAERAAASAAIAARALPIVRAAVAEGFAPVSAFLPIRSEVDTRPLLEALAAEGVPLALPAVTPGGLVFRGWKPGDALVRASFGLSEPPASAPELAPRLLLVPLAAFDRSGGRIGYGKGHYDTAIARLASQNTIRTIGIAFAYQEVEEVPMEPHDRRLDLVVTENDVLIVDATSP
jgi:5-formyltetrahydrofolate cyclo-ligase